MNPLFIAALLTIFIGVVHSVLGERYILIRLFRRPDLPRLGGSDWFTKRTIRFAWHLTTLAWWGSAAQLIFLSLDRSPDRISNVLAVTAVVFFASALVTAIASKGKHLAWIVFLAIAALIWMALR